MTLDKFDIFDYFGGGFSSKESNETDDQHKMKENETDENGPDNCEPGCDSNDVDNCDVLADDPSENEHADNLAELSGKPTSDSSKSDKKEVKKPVFDQTTYICYAGRQFPITKFFADTDSLSKLELEDVRKRLEKHFPELSKQRTKMEWDEKKKFIVPMVTGGKKGAYFSQELKGFFFHSKDLFDHIEPVNILAARDGYYEVRGVRRS